MPKEYTLEQAYNICLTSRKFILQDNIDKEKIRSRIIIAQDDLQSAKNLIKSEDPKWNTIYKLYYDVLHQFTESLLYFDKIKSIDQANMKPFRFAHQHRPRYSMFYPQALRSRRERPLATSLKIYSTCCGLMLVQGFILAYRPQMFIFISML